MKFSRINYEEHALDYLEGQMSEIDREAFRAFLLLHPDLHDEIDGFEMIELGADSAQVLTNKDRLYRKSPVTPWVLTGAALLLLLTIVLWPQKETSMLAEEDLTQTMPQQAIAQDSEGPGASSETGLSSTASGLEFSDLDVNTKPKPQVEEPTVVSDLSISTPATTIDDEKGSENTFFSGEDENEISTPDPARLPRSRNARWKSMEKLPEIEHRLTIPPRLHKIEVIHPSLIQQYSELYEDDIERSKFGQFLTSVNLVPKAFTNDEDGSWKEKLLPDYIVAE